MTRESIVTMVVTLGIAGAASVVWAAPPSDTEALQAKTEFAFFNTALDDLACPGSRFGISAVHSVRHTAGEGGNFDEIAAVSIDLLYFDPDGTLLISSAFHDLSETSTIDLGGLTLLEEFEVQRLQCDPDPGCSNPLENCTFVATESILVDLTWEGIGSIEKSTSNSVVHGEPDEDLVVQHEHVREKSRDAAVTGLVSISVGDLDLEFEIEGIGMLSESIVQANVVGEPECESDEC